MELYYEFRCSNSRSEGTSNHLPLPGIFHVPICHFFVPEFLMNIHEWMVIEELSPLQSFVYKFVGKYTPDHKHVQRLQIKYQDAYAQV